MDLSSVALQVRRSRLELVAVILITLITLAAVIALHVIEDAPFERLVRDPAALTGAPFHQGFLSNAGILLWAAATAVALFTAMAIAVDDRSSAWMWFALATAALSLFATLDDVYLLHEQVLPHGGIREEVTLLAYIAAGVAYLYLFRALLARTKLLLALLACALIAISTLLDMRYPMSTGWTIFIEEAAKFGGIASWLAFVWSASLTAISSSRDAPANGGVKAGV
jgi:uncharacterized membrane protein